MNTHGSTRHGLSLIEVLISIGVMAIGILGTAALLPIGGAEIAEAARLERGASIGRAVFRDSVLRGTLRPENLVAPSGWVELFSGNSMASPTDLGNSVCIDPLFCGRNLQTPPNADNARLSQFPARLDSDMALPSSPNPLPRMTRATLKSNNGVGWMSLREAESMFRWRDDLVFQPFEEDEFTSRALLPARPRQLFASDAQAMSGASRQYAGDYTWMVTLTPAESEDPDPSAAMSRQLYTASFVVFHKRDLLVPPEDKADRTKPPGEKIVAARFSATQPKVLGGGTLTLSVPDTDNTTDPEATDLPKLRANQWILLAGWTMSPIPLQSAMANQQVLMRPVFKWYRVTAVSHKPTYSGGAWNQGISVIGPDWDTSVVSADPTNPNATGLYAILLDGVVGVYEKTIALQR